MGQTVLGVLPLAVAVALSPTAITAVILLLMTPRSTANAAAMATGWIVSLSLVVVVAYVLVSAAGISDRGDAAKVDVLRVVLGGVLVLAGALTMARRRRRHASRQPKWMQALDSFTPLRSFGLGIAMGDVKNLVMTFAAVSGIVYGAHALAEHLAVLVVFVVVGSLGVVGPLVVRVTMDDGAAALQRWHDWLAVHNATVTAVTMLVVGIAVLGQGLAGVMD